MSPVFEGSHGERIVYCALLPEMIIKKGMKFSVNTNYRGLRKSVGVVKRCLTVVGPSEDNTLY